TSDDTSSEQPGSGVTSFESQTQASGSTNPGSRKEKSTRRSVQFESGGVHTEGVPESSSPFNPPRFILPEIAPMPGLEGDGHEGSGLQQINTVIEAFQSNELTKPDALLRILDLISESSYAPNVKTKASKEYIRTLDEIEAEHRNRVQRGTEPILKSAGQDGANTTAEDERSGRERRDGPASEGIGDLENSQSTVVEAERFLSSMVLPPKRPVSERDTELIEYEPVARKRKIDPEKLPWA
ncbi:hypothetical protein H0H93_000327, partial [Arthromyces matolae]